MLLVRLFLVLGALSVGAALAIYLFTRDPRYLDLAWKVFRFFAVLFAAVALIYIVERLVLI